MDVAKVLSIFFYSVFLRSPKVIEFLVSIIPSFQLIVLRSQFLLSSFQFLQFLVSSFQFLVPSFQFLVPCYQLLQFLVPRFLFLQVLVPSSQSLGFLFLVHCFLFLFWLLKSTIARICSVLGDYHIIHYQCHSMGNKIQFKINSTKPYLSYQYVDKS